MWDPFSIEHAGCIDFDTFDESERSTSIREEHVLHNLQRAAYLASLESVAPPWRFLSEQYSILEEECRRRIVSLAALSDDQFLGPLTACDNGEPPSGFVEHDLPAFLPTGRAALRESAELAGLYARLTPSRVSHEAFYFCFMEHVQCARRSVLPPTTMRSPSAERRHAEDEFEAFLTSPLTRASPEALEIQGGRC